MIETLKAILSGWMIHERLVLVTIILLKIHFWFGDSMLGLGFLPDLYGKKIRWPFVLCRIKVYLSIRSLNFSQGLKYLFVINLGT